MVVHELTRAEARRVAVRAQLLSAERPTDLHEVVRRLTMLPVEPTRAIAPASDLVAWSRLGSAYQPADLVDALADGTLVELAGYIRPAGDVALFTAAMAAWPGGDEAPLWRLEQHDWVEANEACRRDILDRLEDDGPLATSQLPDTCELPWRSTGWTNNKNVSRLLELMVQRGEVALAGRAGGERLWDLAWRVYPDDDPVPAEEALRVRNHRRLRALGIARGRAPGRMGEPDSVGDVGEPAVVAGVPREWRVDPEQLDRPFRGRTALLSPFDRLVYDRRRLTDLFAFDYLLEMYKPAAKRRWGYFALPILHGDRLVGKLDATADRGAGVFSVDAIHLDVEISATARSAVVREIRSLADWLQLDVALPDGGPPFSGPTAPAPVS